jgi:hypothetical protein
MVCGNIGGEEDGEGAMTGMVKLIDADRGLLESLRRQLEVMISISVRTGTGYSSIWVLGGGVGSSSFPTHLSLQ